MRISATIFSLTCALGLANAAAISNPFQFVPQPATVVECPATEPTLLKLGPVDIDPNPPQKGHQLTIKGSGTLAEDIVEGAVIDVVVKVGVVKLLTKKFQFCEESVKVNKPCPVTAGDQTLETTVDLPKEIPIGRYTAIIKVTNPGPTEGEPGKLVTCLIAKAQFGIH
ncbi:Phosphatidylglycerol/phosphatidylinositol transfer protein [Mortierella sp. NVP85]|nr:Phosphatidylglycerol/phosphatidylinositol transfer protein [Mortierella sp. NVP85]